MITAVNDQHSLTLQYFVISIMPVKSGDQTTTTRRAKEDYSKSYKKKRNKKQCAATKSLNFRMAQLTK